MQGWQSLDHRMVQDTSFSHLQWAKTVQLVGGSHDDVIKWKHFRVTGNLWREFTVTGEFPAQKPVTRIFDVFIHLRLNKQLSKQWYGWWFDTPSHPLGRHCNGMLIYVVFCLGWPLTSYFWQPWLQLQLWQVFWISISTPAPEVPTPTPVLGNWSPNPTLEFRLDLIANPQLAVTLPTVDTQLAMPPLKLHDTAQLTWQISHLHVC